MAKKKTKRYRVHDYRYPDKVERSIERAQPQPYQTKYKSIRERDIRHKEQLARYELKQQQIKNRKPRSINLKQYSFESLVKQLLCSKKKAKQRREYFGYKSTGRKKGSGSILTNRFRGC